MSKHKTSVGTKNMLKNYIKPLHHWRTRLHQNFVIAVTNLFTGHLAAVAVGTSVMLKIWVTG